MASRDAAVEYEQMAGWLRHFRHLSLRLLRLPSYEFRVYGPDYLARSLPRLEASYKGSRIRYGRCENLQSDESTHDLWPTESRSTSAVPRKTLIFRWLHPRKYPPETQMYSVVPT